MIHPLDSTQLESRLAAAAARCAALRVSGPLEVYMEAFDDVEALELQLTALTERLQQEHV